MEVNNLIAAANEARAKTHIPEALVLGREAVAQAPENPVAHNTLGLIYAADMELGLANEHFSKAVELAPEAAHYRINKAYALIQAGNFEEAETLLREALKIDPESGAAYQNLTWIRTCVPDDGLIDTLEALKAKPGADDASYMQYCFALGKCYDDIGEFDKAFASYQAGNERAGVSYNKEAYETFIKGLKYVWSEEFAEHLQGGGYESDKPVFIIGFPRSGSLLLERKIAEHSQLEVLGERPDVISIANMIAHNHPKQLRYPAFCHDMNRDSLVNFGKHYVEKFEAKHPGALKLVNKNLNYFNYVGFIRAITPGARFIEAKRNPADICLSCYFQNLDSSHNYKFDFASLAHYFVLYEELMKHWREVYGEIHTVQYETVINDPDQEADKALTFLGLDASLKENGKTPAYIATASAWQARQPVYATSVNRWKNYRKHLAPLLEAFDEADIDYDGVG